MRAICKNFVEHSFSIYSTKLKVKRSPYLVILKTPTFCRGFKNSSDPIAPSSWIKLTTYSVLIRKITVATGGSYP